MIIVTRINAAPGDRFAPDAFDENIGTDIPVTIPDSDRVGHGTVVAAEVSPDGDYCDLTLDVPGLASNGVDLGRITFETDHGDEYVGDADEGIGVQ